ncbi:reduction in Cnn dots 6 isoform X1 [Haematobia irritans]|uniref:reduction in Cnn dots 6 isoform X1 n=2 Tax=Haematobia irritans TaxID=7368 RepID=UPI003F4FADC5
MNSEKQSETYKSISGGGGGADGITSFWNQYVMERFIKANLFVICCVAAGLLLIVYLGAFSCEVSWILEARGDLPYAAYVLCTQYFIVFVATTILIHGLVTGLPWGLFAWSIVIGILSIPELIYVMIMTTQHWGLQSVHGLTELIAYLIRLIINCFALICVIPTGLRWRRESQVLTQLQDLATRLQLQTPPPSVPILSSKADSRRSSKRLQNQQHAFENSGYQVTETSKTLNPGSQPQGLNLFGSQNEFNASMFAIPFMQQQQFNPPGNPATRNGNRAQSLMDLRCTLPGLYNPRYVIENSDEKNGKYFNITIDDLKNNLQDTQKQPPSLIGSTSNDPIYCSIEPKQPSPIQQRGQREPMALPTQATSTSQPVKLARNCISLENLEGINKVQNDLAAYGHNLLQNYNQQQQYYLAMLGYLQEHQPQQFPSAMGLYRRPGSQASLNPQVLSGTGALPQQFQRRPSQQLQYYGGFGYANYTNPYITANSKLSLGNESDDYRKYRDVAL